MAMLIPDMIARVDLIKNENDAWPYQPVVMNENDQVIWSGPTMTYSAERAMEMAQDAVESICYLRRHQLPLAL